MPVQTLNLNSEVRELVVRKLEEMFNGLDEKFYIDLLENEKNIVLIESFLRMNVFYEKLQDFDLEFLLKNYRKVNVDGQIKNHLHKIEEISRKNPCYFATHILDPDLSDNRREYRKYLSDKMSLCKKLIDISRT